jgi:TonB family protein
VKRVAATGLMFGMLLCSSFARSQQSHGCRPLSHQQPATRCGYVLPVYPPEAKAAGIEGTVAVFVQVNRSGEVDWVRVIGGPEPLRQAAADAVQYWRYRPYLVGGTPRGFRTVVKVKFRLEKPTTRSSLN